MWQSDVAFSMYNSHHNSSTFSLPDKNILRHPFAEMQINRKYKKKYSYKIPQRYIITIFNYLITIIMHNYYAIYLMLFYDSTRQNNLLSYIYHIIKNNIFYDHERIERWFSDNYVIIAVATGHLQPSPGTG